MVRHAYGRSLKKALQKRVLAVLTTEWHNMQAILCCIFVCPTMFNLGTLPLRLKCWTTQATREDETGFELKTTSILAEQSMSHTAQLHWLLSQRFQTSMDIRGQRRRFKASNFHTGTKVQGKQMELENDSVLLHFVDTLGIDCQVGPFNCSMPLNLEPGWNQAQWKQLNCVVRRNELSVLELSICHDIFLYMQVIHAKVPTLCPGGIEMSLCVVLAHLTPAILLRPFSGLWGVHMRIDSQTLLQSHLFNVDGQVLISTTY